MSNEIYFRIDEKEFEKRKELARQYSIDSDPNDEDAKDSFVFTDDNGTFQKLDIFELEYDVEYEVIRLTVTSELGSFTIALDVDNDFFIDSLNGAIKKMNKIKTVLEATK